MLRFLVRTAGSRAAHHVAHLARRVRALLHRPEQRGPDARRTPGHPGDDRRSSRPGSASTSRSGSSTSTSSGKALHGDLGYDYYHQVPVTTIMAQALPITLSLVARRSHDLARPGGLQRRRLRDPAPVVHRPVADGVLALLLLDADVPARTAAALLPLLPAHRGGLPVLPAGRLRPAERRPRAMGPAPDPAVVHARARRRPPPTPGSPGPRCSTCSARTTSAPRGPRASARAGSSSGTRCARA